ncbi:unnamed protein product, partial [Adineta ricciae]
LITTAPVVPGQLERKEEEVLSQKFSQLSADDELELSEDNVLSGKKRRCQTSMSPDIIPKKIKLSSDDSNNETTGGQSTSDEFQESFDNIPAYLLLTNPLFIDVVQKILNAARSISANDLQIIAVLMHHIAALRMQKYITHLYLRAGTGKLSDPNSDLQGSI